MNAITTHTPLTNMEPLLCQSEKRMALFPILHDDLWSLYKTSVACFWTVGEVDLSNDLLQWKDKLNSEERQFVSLVLAFFAIADSIVADNLAERFAREVTWYECKCFYAFQATMENIHSEMYSLLIDTYIQNQEEKSRLLNAASTFPCIQKKAEWAKKWIASDDNFAVRVVAFAVVEGVFFSGSFCAIFWLKSKGLMPGLSHANQLISRDEGLHQEYAVHLYRRHLKNKLSEATIHELVASAVDVEVEFITEACNVNLIGMNGSDMAEYIRYVADRLVVQLGYSKIYNATNPFQWMELISLEGRTNFFESRVSEYKKAGVTSDHGFDINGDF